MNWLNRAEARFGFLAIPGLPYIIAGFNVLVYVLTKLDPKYELLLDIDFGKVMEGEVWRVVTFVFIPRYGMWLVPGPLAFVMYVLFLCYVGGGVERAMGPFRFTLFYLVGMIGLIVAAAMAGPAVSAMLLNVSLIFAFARYFPDATMLLYVIPVPVVWVARFWAAVLVWIFLTGAWAVQLSAVVAVSNFLLFFGRDLWRDARHRQKAFHRRVQFDREVRLGAAEPLHECVVCRRTEQTPDLEFRIARDGQEYCAEHLPKSAPAR